MGWNWPNGVLFFTALETQSRVARCHSSHGTPTVYAGEHPKTICTVSGAWHTLLIPKYNFHFLQWRVQWISAELTVSGTGHWSAKKWAVQGSDLIWPQRTPWCGQPHSLASHDFTQESTWSCWSCMSSLLLSSSVNTARGPPTSVYTNPYFLGGWCQMVWCVGCRTLILTADEGFLMFLSTSG